MYCISASLYIPYNVYLFKYTLLFNIHWGLNVVNIVLVKNLNQEKRGYFNCKAAPIPSAK